MGLETYYETDTPIGTAVGKKVKLTNPYISNNKVNNIHTCQAVISF